MADGDAKQRLNHYLAGAREEAIGNAGQDWQRKGQLLDIVSDALRNRGPALAERLGKDSQTAAGLREALLKASSRMSTTSSKLSDAGDALVVVGDHLEKARVLRKSMKNLVEPPAFVEPTYAGAQPTPDEILDAATKRAASNKEHGDYQTASTGQEADAAEITSKLDHIFLSAIPPMMAIHGGPDPTKKKKQTGNFVQTTGETDGERRRRQRREDEAKKERAELDRLKQAEYERREQAERDRAEAERERERERQERLERERAEREQRERERAEREQRERERAERERQERQERDRQEQERRDRERHQPYTPVSSDITNVHGGTDGGTTYQVADSSTSTSAQPATSTSTSGPSTSGSSLGVGAGVAGASAAMVRGGGMPSLSGSVSASAPNAAIGAGSRIGAPSALGSATGSAGPATPVSGTTSGSTAAGSASRSAGAPGSAGSTSGRAGAGRSAGASNGSRSAGGGRGNRKDDKKSNHLEAIVYDQDWLGDDSAAPGVLD